MKREAKIYEVITSNDIKNYTVRQIDDVIEALTSYSNHYVQTNNIVKLRKVVELQGILIDARCEKLGIVIPA